MKVLTEKGFREFDGILDRGISDSLILFNFSNGKSLKCTENHELLCEDGISYLPAFFLEVGDVLYPNIEIVDKIVNIKNENVYDLLNVDETKSYVSNDVISHNCIFLDEFAFVHKAEQFYTSTYPVISSGKDTKVIITSTPNGVGNMFYKLWQGAISNSNEFKAFSIHWRDVPGRDEAWRAKTIANTSEAQFDQEFGCQFVGSADTLISSSCLLGLQAMNPVKTQHDIVYYDEPNPDHSYILVADVAKGRGQDYSTFSVIDITSKPFKQVCTYRNNTISPLLFPGIIVRAAIQYNQALVIVENNDAGQVVCNAIYYDYEYENMFTTSAVKSNGIGVVMTKKVKRIGCSNLKDLMEANKIHIVDPHTISELANFVPRGDSFAAADNTHDDSVMNLVLFAWFVSTDIFNSMSDVDLRELLYAEKILEMEEDLPPFGFVGENTPSISAYDELINNAREWNGL